MKLPKRVPDNAHTRAQHEGILRAFRICLDRAEQDHELTPEEHAKLWAFALRCTPNEMCILVATGATINELIHKGKL